MDRRVSMSDSASEAEVPEQAEPKSKAKAKAKAKQPAAKPTKNESKAVEKEPKAKVEKEPKPKVEKQAKAKAKATPSMKRPAAAMKRPAKADSKAAVGEAPAADALSPTDAPRDDETSQAGEGEAPAADGVSSDDKAPLAAEAPGSDALAAPGPRDGSPGPKKRRNLKAEDFGLPKALYITAGPDNHTFFNMRYVKKGQVSVRIKETMQVVFTVSQQQLVFSILAFNYWNSIASI